MSKPMDWMRRGVVRAAVVLGAALLLMGMGGGDDGGSGGTIPIPEKNFTATVADAEGNSLEAQRVTWEGNVFFKAQFGNATITLPFEKVRSLEVTVPEGSTTNQVRASVTMRDGESINIGLERDSKLYGETAFGNYEIFVKDVRTITFQ